MEKSGSDTRDQRPSATVPPGWVPDAVHRYLAHIEKGRSIRDIARTEGCHPSTVLRQIRRLETRRDDPLIDSALRRMGHADHGTGDAPGALSEHQEGKGVKMTLQQPVAMPPEAQKEAAFRKEARRVLRRLCETGAVLAVAQDMDKAVVVRDTGTGTPSRTAVVTAEIAEALALKAWIACDAPARISRYHVTAAGRSALNKMVAEDANRASGFSEAQASFDHGNATEKPRRLRYSIADSPLATLARRRDKTGAPFLDDVLVAAGERLREDFELAQVGARVTQNWDSFLTGPTDGGGGQLPPGQRGTGPEAARERVAAALRDLGPGLGDVALRCCCYLEGLETAEKRMGWSARSGKIVLRIALQRLRRHYEDTQGRFGPLIG